MIVNGVRFSESAATLGDEHGLKISRADLRLGSMVRVEGSVDANASGSALKVTAIPSVAGKVETIDAAGGTLTVLGQKVVVDANTVFEGIGGLAALTVGDLVEVHGLLGTGQINATLIEKKATLILASVRGTVKNLNAGAGTFEIGALVVRIGTAKIDPKADALVDGVLVSMRSEKAPVAGVLEAGSIKVRQPQAGRARRSIASISRD